MLMRFDPFRELDRLTQATWGQNRPTMAMDAYRRNGDFVVNFDLPGVDPATIDLTVEKNVLTVTAERAFSRNEGDEIVVSERPQGRFSRQLFLGESLDSDHIQASYEHGVLTLHIPVAEKAKPRKVEVTTGGQPAVEVMSAAS
jgi:HSP20 family protein